MTGFLNGKRYVIIDRDTKFCDAFRQLLGGHGVDPLLLPPRSPNLNAHLERFLRSLKTEALGKLILFGEQSLRRAIPQFHLEINRKTRLVGDPA